MNHAYQVAGNRLRATESFQHRFRTIVLLSFLFLGGCATMPELSKEPEAETRTDEFEHGKILFAEGNYEAAYEENRRILSEGKGAPDLALFNMGLVSAYSLNPKKNYPRALASFKTLVSDHPESPLIEQAKAWIQVLEEQRRVVEEKQRVVYERQRVLEDKQKLIEEKRSLIREREILSQEREKLIYTVEKSRQVDIEIEKRRRQTLTK